PHQPLNQYSAKLDTVNVECSLLETYFHYNDLLHALSDSASYGGTNESDAPSGARKRRWMRRHGMIRRSRFSAGWPWANAIQSSAGEREHR
ncbi:MAG: hypothetical protein ACO1O3_00050, partial [Sphingobium sp.]